MSLKEMMIVAHFSVGLLALINAINSRTTVRSALSYTFSGIVLISAFFVAFSHVAALKEKKIEAQKKRYRQQLEAVQAGIQNSKGDAVKEKEKQLQNDLADIANQAYKISSTILRTNVDALDADWDWLYQKAKGYGAQIHKLKNRLAGLKVEKKMDNTLKQARSTLSKGLKSAGACTYYFRLFFQSESIAQEDERYERYRASARRALAHIKKAKKSLR